MDVQYRHVRGSRHVVTVPRNAEAALIVSAACAKFACHDRCFPTDHQFELRYPDGILVQKLPERDAAFTLNGYK